MRTVKAKTQAHTKVRFILKNNSYLYFQKFHRHTNLHIVLSVKLLTLTEFPLLTEKLPSIIVSIMPFIFYEKNKNTLFDKKDRKENKKLEQ